MDVLFGARKLFSVLFGSLSPFLSLVGPGILAVQSDREGQPRGPGNNHIVFAKVGEPDKPLLVLVLVDAARIVGDDHRLLHSFDTQRLAAGAVWIKLAPKSA